MRARKRSSKWREIARRIEREQDCGAFGLCYYMYVFYPREYALRGQLNEHLRTYHEHGGDIYVDRRGVWETRVLLAYFLALEAEDVGQ